MPLRPPKIARPVPYTGDETPFIISVVGRLLWARSWIFYRFSYYWLSYKFSGSADRRSPSFFPLTVFHQPIIT